MPAGKQNSIGQGGPLRKILGNLTPFGLVQSGKTGQRRTFMSIVRRGNTPYPPIPIRPLFKLIWLILFNAIGRVGDNGMDACLWHALHPFEAIRVEYQRFFST